jgi:hypothetical protein
MAPRHTDLVTPVERIDAVALLGHRRLVDGADVDEVLAFFDTEGLGIVAAVRAAMLAFELTLVDARELVESAQPYNSNYATAVDWHRRVLRRLQPRINALRKR